MRFLICLVTQALCLLLLICDVAAATQWVPYAADEDGVQHFYDKSSVTRTGLDMVRVWTRWQLTGEDKREFMRDTGSEPGYVRSLVELRCTRREHRSVKILYEDQNGGEILSFDDPSGEWEDIERGSVTDSLHRAVCIYGEYSI